MEASGQARWFERLLARHATRSFHVGNQFLEVSHAGFK